MKLLAMEPEPISARTGARGVRRLDYEALDKQKILQRLRQTLEPRISKGDVPDPTVEYVVMPNDDDDEDMSLLKNGTDIYNVPLVSSRRLGFLLIFARRVWRKILKPVLERQVLYNEANARIIETLCDQFNGLYQEVQTLKQEIQSNLTHQLKQAIDQIQSNAITIATLQAEIDRLRAVQQEQVKIIKRLTAENHAEVGKN